MLSNDLPRLSCGRASSVLPVSHVYCVFVFEFEFVFLLGSPRPTSLRCRAGWTPPAKTRACNRDEQRRSRFLRTNTNTKNVTLGGTFSGSDLLRRVTVTARVGHTVWAHVWTDFTPSEIAAGLHAGVLRR